MIEIDEEENDDENNVELRRRSCRLRSRLTDADDCVLTTVQMPVNQTHPATITTTTATVPLTALSPATTAVITMTLDAMTTQHQPTANRPTQATTMVVAARTATSMTTATTPAIRPSGTGAGAGTCSADGAGNSGW